MATPLGRTWTRQIDVAQLYLVYRKLSQMLNPGPAQTFVILDEREDTINDAFFAVQMNSWINHASDELFDFPASYHGGAGGLAFADGHSEIHKWRDARTMPPIVTNGRINDQSCPNNLDVYWLQDHSTRQK